MTELVPDEKEHPDWFTWVVLIFPIQTTNMDHLVIDFTEFCSRKFKGICMVSY